MNCGNFLFDFFLNFIYNYYRKKEKETFVMEMVEFKYCFKEDDEAKEVTVCKKTEDGIHDYDVCEMFLDFMKSVGFCEDNICNYFNEG